MSTSTNKNSIMLRKMTYLAILTAIVFVLQYLSLFTRFSTFSLTFVLVPIVIGVSICGVWAGAWLGFVFALAVFATGDAALFLGWDIPATIFLVILKGVAAGLCAGLVFRLVEKKNRYLAIFLSAITAPIVNTGIFFLGSLIFFYDDIISYSIDINLPTDNVAVFVLTVFIGVNFFIELGTNILLAPAVRRIIDIAKNKR